MTKLYTVRTETGHMEICDSYELAVALKDEIYDQTGIESEITVTTAVDLREIIEEKKNEIYSYYEEINYMWPRGQIGEASFHRELAKLSEDLDKWIVYRNELA